MVKFLILLTCLVGLVAAGVLDKNWMRDGRMDHYRTGYDDKDDDIRVVDTISRMTGVELERQKFLLKLLDHVHQTLNVMSLGNNRDEFDTNEQNYKKGIDEDMLHVIQLQRNGGLLGKRDIFSVSNKDHKRQMIGLKRLLTRAIDFDTFAQNSYTARNLMNGVLFVNALLLAVRERDDTRQLIVPAIHEILPELYIDRDTLRTLMNMDINLLTSSNGFDTRRPNLLDMIGLNGGLDRFDRLDAMQNRNAGGWGKLGNLVSLNRNRLNVDEKIVIDDVNKDTKAKTMKLLTEDVGFKGFLHQLINDLCLKENELEKSKMRGRDRMGGLYHGKNVLNDEHFGSFDRENRMRDDIYGGKHEIFGRNQYGNKFGQNLPITTIDDERLLHVNGKKLLTLNDMYRGGDFNSRNMNLRDRFYDVVYTDGIGDGRKIKDILNVECLKCIDRQTTKDCNKCLMTTDDYVLDRLGNECKKCIRDVNDYDCDKCKNKINYNGINTGRNDIFDDRRLNYGRNNLIDNYRRNRIDDGRRTVYTSDIDEKNHVFLRNTLNQLNTNCVKCIDRKDFDDCNKCKRTTDDDVLDRLDKNCRECIRNVNDYDCDKCKNKLNPNRLGFGRDDTFDNTRFNDDSDRFMDNYRSNRIYDGRRTVDTSDINGVLTGKLNQLNNNCIKCIARKTFDDCNECKRTTNDNLITQLDQNCKKCILDVNNNDCDKCKTKIDLDRQNIHHLNNMNDNGYNKDQNSRDHFMDVVSKHNINYGRRIRYSNDFDDSRRGFLNDDMNLNRLNVHCQKCIDRKTINDCNMCLKTTDDYVLDRLDRDCKKCIQDLNDYDCDNCKTKIINGRTNVNRFGGDNDDDLDWKRFNTFDDNRRSLRYNDFGVDSYDIRDHKKSTKSEILLHNLKQVLSRINLERLSLGLDTIDDIINDEVGDRKYLGLVDSMSYGRRDIGTNDRDIQRLVDVVNTKIIQKLKNVKLDGRKTDIDVDRVISKALIDRDGDINILDILTDLIVRNIDGGRDNMQIVKDIGHALNDHKVLKTLRKLIKTVDKVRTEILGVYTRNDLEFNDVKINDVVVDELVTCTKDKDIDLKNLVDDKTKMMVVRQKQLTHKDFNIKIDVDSKRNQRVVVRTLIGPKRFDDMGRELSLDERRSAFMLLDTDVVELNVGRNLIQRRSRDLDWTKRGTTTLTKLYKLIMMADRNIDRNFVNNDITTMGQDCRFPHRLILPRGRFDGLDLELLVVITRFDGDGIGDVDTGRIDTSKKCVMGMSVKGVDKKSLGFPFDRDVDDIRDIRTLNNVVGVDVKIYHDDRKGLF